MFLCSTPRCQENLCEEFIFKLKPKGVVLEEIKGWKFLSSIPDLLTPETLGGEQPCA